jgi:hypothetical protein
MHGSIARADSSGFLKHMSDAMSHFARDKNNATISSHQAPGGQAFALQAQAVSHLLWIRMAT